MPLASPLAHLKEMEGPPRPAPRSAVVAAAVVSSSGFQHHFAPGGYAGFAPLPVPPPFTPVAPLPDTLSHGAHFYPSHPPPLIPPPAPLANSCTALALPDTAPPLLDLVWTPLMDLKFMQYLDSPAFVEQKSRPKSTKEAGLWASVARDLAAQHTCFYISDDHPSVLKDPRNGRGVPFRKRARAARLPPTPPFPLSPFRVHRLAAERSDADRRPRPMVLQRRHVPDGHLEHGSNGWHINAFLNGIRRARTAATWRCTGARVSRIHPQACEHAGSLSSRPPGTPRPGIGASRSRTRSHPVARGQVLFDGFPSRLPRARPFRGGQHVRPH